MNYEHRSWGNRRKSWMSAHSPDYTLNLSSNLGISHQELCPHPAREDPVLSNLLILLCWNPTKTSFCYSTSPFLSHVSPFSRRLWRHLSHLKRLAARVPPLSRVKRTRSVSAKAQHGAAVLLKIGRHTPSVAASFLQHFLVEWKNKVCLISSYNWW